MKADNSAKGGGFEGCSERNGFGVLCMSKLWRLAITETSQLTVSTAIIVVCSVSKEWQQHVDCF